MNVIITTLDFRLVFFFFFNDPATPDIYPLPLHDALPISPRPGRARRGAGAARRRARGAVRVQSRDPGDRPGQAAGADLRQGVHRADGAAPRVAGAAVADRKSTRLNSSHSQISYAVFCLKQ